MPSISVRRALIICFCSVSLLILFTQPASAQRGWHQGDTWLKWSHKVREAYVFGYAVGYSTAHDESACGTVARNDRPEDPDFSKNTDYFVKSITEFYHRYPEDRELSIHEVLDQLARGLTIEQVHVHPFPRHRTGGQH